MATAEVPPPENRDVTNMAACVRALWQETEGHYVGVDAHSRAAAKQTRPLLSPARIIPPKPVFIHFCLPTSVLVTRTLQVVYVLGSWTRCGTLSMVRGVNKVQDSKLSLSLWGLFAVFLKLTDLPSRKVTRGNASFVSRQTLKIIMCVCVDSAQPL